MTKTDPKSQSGSTEKSLRELRDILEVVKSKVAGTSGTVSLLLSQVRFLRDHQSVISEKLDVHEEKLKALIRTAEEHEEKLNKLIASDEENTPKLDSIRLSILEIEKAIKGYSDMYQQNTDKIDGLDTRLTRVENRAAIPGK